MVPSNPVGSGQAELGSGLVPLRERAPWWAHAHIQTQSYMHASYSHAPRCRALSLSSIVHVFVRTHTRVCVRVSICDSSITPTVRSTAWLPARHCSLAVFLIDILIGRFECRL